MGFSYFMDIDKKEMARDVLALGSWVFYVLVIGRALIKPYRPFVDQLVIAAFVLVVIGFFISKVDWYVARGLVLAVFTILFYEDAVYSGFAVVASVLLIVSSKYVGTDLRKILFGVVVGTIAVFAGYYGVLLY